VFQGLYSFTTVTPEIVGLGPKLAISKGGLMDFETYRAKVALKEIPKCLPVRTHDFLVRHRSSHCLVKGRIVVVVDYLWDHLWVVNIQQKPIIVHELDCEGLFTRQFLLERGRSSDT
jgi:hypothetical protein